MPEPSPGRRGTRPHNRRELILAAAAELFAKHGYAKVGMGDLADAVGIAPSGGRTRRAGLSVRTPATARSIAAWTMK